MSLPASKVATVVGVSDIVAVDVHGGVGCGGVSGPLNWMAVVAMIYMCHALTVNVNLSSSLADMHALVGVSDAIAVYMHGRVGRCGGGGVRVASPLDEMRGSGADSDDRREGDEKLCYSFDLDGCITSLTYTDCSDSDEMDVARVFIYLTLPTVRRLNRVTTTIARLRAI